MSTRAEDGTRWIDGKLFTFVFQTSDKSEAKQVAEQVRKGNHPCGHAAHGCHGPHYARVVRRNWHDHSLEMDDGEMLDLNDWAVFAFPKEAE